MSWVMSPLSQRGDVIAYQILEMKDGGPSYSAHKVRTRVVSCCALFYCHRCDWLVAIELISW